MSNFSFDGIRKNYCDYMDYTSGWGQTRELEITDVKGRPGGVLNNIAEKVREIEATILVDATYNTRTLEELADDFVGWLTTDEPKPLIFDREPDKIYYAILSSQIDVERFVSFGKVTVKFTCIDPYKYASKGSTNTAISDQVSVANVGNADTPITVEATALKPSSYFMIANGDEEYFMVGDDDVTKETVNYMPPVLHTELQTLSGWTKVSSGAIPDNYLGGTVGGTFEIGNVGESFRVSKFPDATSGWVGAQYRRTLSRSLQDWQITYKCIVEKGMAGAGHTAQHIYDTDNRLIASIGYENKYHNKKNGHVMVILFNQNGDPKKIYDFPDNPKYYKLKRMVVYIRLRRVGNTFSIKSWKYNHIKDGGRKNPIDVSEKVWVDKGKFYQRPISGISVSSFKPANYNWMEMNGLGTFNTEILPKPKGAKDVIIQKGDVVTIDMQTNNVVIGEEPMLSEKTFGSEFFNIDKGYSELYIYPTGVFDTKITWQDRYL